LPARGKSYLSAKIVGYFNWLGIPSKVFNAGRKRRSQEDASKSGRADFFVKDNSIAVSKRDLIALETLTDALTWLERENGTIAVFDATNTTRERRRLILTHIASHELSSSPQVVFIESICNDSAVLHNNLLQKVLHSPDFAGMAVDLALADLKERICAYEAVYETVEDDEGLSYIKVIDLANKMVCCRVWDSIPLRTVQLLMSCHLGTRPVYLVRAGQCEGIDDLSSLLPPDPSPLSATAFVDNSGSPYAEDSPSSAFPAPDTPSAFPTLLEPPQRSRAQSIRMPSALTCSAVLNERGRAFSAALARFIASDLSLSPSPTTTAPLPSAPQLSVITSTLPRAVETAALLPCPPEAMQQRSALGILDTGIYHGMAVETIRAQFPDEYQRWKQNPFVYRFAGGESILDMNRRLADLVLEIERHREPVVIVSHLSPLQSLVAYFTSREPREIPLVSVPQHAVVKLVPSIYGWSVETLPLALAP
jgi:6-phosphofructo-2-kinase